ncbi:hypothetical protein NGRA_2508 [Nosema granulosis]|uniref:ISXO2-like transposase domain-containing protein n=1 Tax=Nosema granulosis TaxID=83296 RepID=A0A9P6GXA8_9MICR|nr:hypothetical protein NGRA_2508 [Nosema granulosis]
MGLRMVEKDSKVCSFVILPNRRAETIILIIISRFLPGTIILTDCWAAYNKIREYPEYEHFTVNHRYNFVNPDDSSVNTQTIESCWVTVKKLKTQHGSNHVQLVDICTNLLLKEFTKNKCALIIY